MQYKDSSASRSEVKVKAAYMKNQNLTCIDYIHRETYEFVKRAESVCVDYITVHGRTRKQKSTEPVNFEGIKLVKESVSMPVFANGSIFSNADAEEMYDKTGVDGVMSARGLLQNPAFFSGYEYTPWECIEVCNPCPM